MPPILTARPRLAVSHCSRAQLLVSACLRIPIVFIGDYEFSTTSALIHPTWYVCPEVIPTAAVRGARTRLLKYPGIKEDVYVPRFVPSLDLRSRLALPETDVVVTLRPPATEAHYHAPASEELFHAALAFLSAQPHVTLVVVPRTDRQRHDLRARYPSLVRHGALRLLEHAVDGLDLIWHSDLVISGGGTMNREASALGVPVYSTFRGRIGAVDRYLSDTGRLVLLESVDDVHTKIVVARRHRPSRPLVGGDRALTTIVDHITSLVVSSEKRPRAMDLPAGAAEPLA
jgi:predicted glycosyltransferase